MTPRNFPKANRLLNKDDFAFLKSGSQSEKARWALAFFKDSRTGKSKTRIGISASKKVGCAVKRNKVKRQIREYFRNSEFRELGKDVLLVVHPKFFSDSSSTTKFKIDSSMDIIFSRILNNDKIR